MAALEQRIFDIVQDERHRIDPAARPLALDSELLGVARRRSADMAKKNYVAHSSPEGETSASLIMGEDGDFQGLLGENLAAQPFNRKFGVDVNTYAHRVVGTWLS
ncbi:MAG: CAP domain-containing protein, partial [Rhizomicrobium sp.]